MAGGLGSRLYPLTLKQPKPMVPLVNKPALGHILGLLKHHHFTDVVITVRYLSDQIREYCGNGHQFGMRIQYAQETTPLGTAGSVKNAQHHLDDEPFLVISSDIVTDIDLSDLVRFHRKRKVMVTVALKEVTNADGYGVVLTDQAGRISQYLEKPNTDGEASKLINTGVYVLDPNVLNLMESGVASDFSYHIFPQLIRKNLPFYGYASCGYWRDIGMVTNYRQATADMLTGKIGKIDLGKHLGKGVWIGSNVEIAPDVVLKGPIYVGHGVKIKRGVTIQGPTVICDQTLIDRGAWIDQSIISRYNYVGEAAAVYNSITSQQCHLTPESVTVNRLVGADTEPVLTKAEMQSQTRSGNDGANVVRYGSLERAFAAPA